MLGSGGAPSAGGSSVGVVGARAAIITGVGGVDGVVGVDGREDESELVAVGDTVRSASADEASGSPTPPFAPLALDATALSHRGLGGEARTPCAS